MGSQRVGHDWVTELNLYPQQTGLLSQVSLGFASDQGLPHPWKFFPPYSTKLCFFFPLLSSLPFPFSPLLLCPPLFYLASKLLIILIGEQFYLHFSVLDASGASLSNAHQGEYPPNRKTSLSLWRGCLLTQLLRKRRYSLHYYICYSIQLLCGISFYEWNKLLSTFSWTISLCYLIFSDKNMRTLYCWI